MKGWEAFLLTDFEKIFSSLSEEELGELLENVEVSCDKKDEKKIRALAFEKAGLEEKKKKGKIFYLRAFAAAACLCAVALCAVLGVRTLSKPDAAVETTTQSASSSAENPLMLAISNGDEGLIETLLKSGVFVSRDVLKYAVDCTSFLSYNVISDIAKAVESIFGSTGLDPLLESTLTGNSKRALKELKKREGILMTPSERLAFFFSVAFCDSDVVEAFSEKGISLDSTDAAGNNILQIAEKYGNSENEQFAREHGIGG